MARSILIPELPWFVAPMLAKRGVPFDSSEHLFEIKWDGTRVLAYADSRGHRLVNRHRADVTDRYPELGFLNDLPVGTVLDGEVVVLRQGKPDFRLLLTRNQARASLKIRSLAVCRHGLEGVVAKRLDGRYRPGRRAWIKIKPRSGSPVSLPRRHDLLSRLPSLNPFQAPE
jgi:ATP-dependent DNA ligase